MRKMGKPTGFMEYPREATHDRAPAERMKDWSESHPPYGEDVLRKQGARCMDCGIPFCHTGKLIAGMASGCPVNNLIPEWNDLVYRGQWEEAYIRLHEDEQLPRVHRARLPGAVRGVAARSASTTPPVTIKPIEREIIDRAFERGLGEAAAAAGPDRQAGRGGRLRPRRASPPPRSSTAPATWSRSSSARTAWAGCSCTASRT